MKGCRKGRAPGLSQKVAKASGTNWLQAGWWGCTEDWLRWWLPLHILIQSLGLETGPLSLGILRFGFNSFDHFLRQTGSRGGTHSIK